MDRWCLVVEWRKTGYSVIYGYISVYIYSLGRSISRETVYVLRQVDLNRETFITAWEVFVKF
jgi:hypothetical protein